MKGRAEDAERREMYGDEERKLERYQAEEAGGEARRE